MVRSRSEIGKFIRNAEEREFWQEVEEFSRSNVPVARKAFWVSEQFAGRPQSERANGIAQVLRRREPILEVCQTLGVAPLSIALVDEEPENAAKFLELDSLNTWLCHQAFRGSLDIPGALRFSHWGEEQQLVWDAESGEPVRHFRRQLPKWEEALVEGLYVPGDLSLETLNVTSLPARLWVGGSLMLCGCTISSLPADLQVENRLDLSGTRIAALPEGLHLIGSLVLTGSNLEVLPSSLYLGGSIELAGSQIRHIPAGLRTSAGLDLRNIQGISLADDLVVGLSAEEGGRNDARLRLEGTGLQRLPRGLVVHGALEIQGTPITELPDDIRVTNRIALTGSGVHALPVSCAHLGYTGIDANRQRDLGLIRTYAPDIIQFYLKEGSIPIWGATTGRASCRLCGEKIPKSERQVCLDTSSVFPHALNERQWMSLGRNYFHPKCWSEAGLPEEDPSEMETAVDASNYATSPERTLARIREMDAGAAWEVALKIASKVAAMEKARIIACAAAGAEVALVMKWCEGEGIHPLSLLAHMDRRKTVGKKFGVDGAILAGLEPSDKGSLTFKQSEMVSLPPGIRLTGDLRIQNCPRLTTLPQDLEIGGALILRSVGLLRIPEGLKVPGYLGIYGCNQLKALPEGLELGSNVGVHDTPLESMPSRLVVQGSLELRLCKTLSSLPAYLRVGGNLDIGGSGVLRLPEDMEVGGSISAWNTSGWRILPKGFRKPGSDEIGFFGSLGLEGTDLEVLPEGLTVEGSLSCSRCEGLQSIPASISVGGDLDLSGTSISSLPNRLVVPGSLDLSDCPKLTVLPEDLVVGKSLNLSNTGIRSLPDGLRIAGRLYLEDMNYLKSLPADLEVGEELFMYRTNARIPATAKVGGNIYLR